MNYLPQRTMIIIMMMKDMMNMMRGKRLKGIEKIITKFAWKIAYKQKRQ